jgi:hypothetical protein
MARAGCCHDPPCSTLAISIARRSTLTINPDKPWSFE